MKTRKDIIEEIVISNLEMAHSMSLEDYDNFVMDLLYSYMGKMTDDELRQEHANLIGD